MAGDACTAVGLTPNILRFHATVAQLGAQLPAGLNEEQLADIPYNVPPPGISLDRLKKYADDVAANADKVCSTPELAAEAAVVVGYATEVESINADVAPDVRQREVELDFRRFQVLLEKGSQAQDHWSEILDSTKREVSFVTEQWFAHHTTEEDPIPPTQTEILGGVLQKVRETKATGKTPVAVFDLDDSVLNPEVRSLKILRDFVKTNPNFFAQLPTQQRRCANQITHEDLVYDIVNDLYARCGIENKEFRDALGKFWFANFFTNSYAAMDPEYPGAAAFVTAVQQAGAKIVYFTGRQDKNDEPEFKNDGMREGTMKALKLNGFPIPTPGSTDVQLIMKPRFKTDDMDYKKATMPLIEKEGVVIAVFDNEPKADGIFTNAWKTATVVRVGQCRAPNKASITKPDGNVRPFTLKDVIRPPATTKWIQDFRRLASAPPALQKTASTVAPAAAAK